MQDDNNSSGGSSSATTVIDTIRSRNTSFSSSEQSSSLGYSISDSSDENDNNLHKEKPRTRTALAKEQKNQNIAEQKKTPEKTSDDSELDRDTPDSDLVLVPRDPNEWDTDHIKQWLAWASRKFKIDPPAQLDRFPETGKELCDMSKAEFWVCAGSKYGGDTLAKHIAHLIYCISGVEKEEFLSSEDPSE